MLPPTYPVRGVVGDYIDSCIRQYTIIIILSDIKMNLKEVGI